MTDFVTLAPTAGSRWLVLLLFILPLAAVYVIGFDSLLTALFSGFLLLVGVKGVSLFVPSWNTISWNGETLAVKSGPGAPLRLEAGQLQEAGEWTLFFLPTYTERPVLIWRDEAGRRREKRLFHVYGSGMEETRAILSGRAPSPARTDRPGSVATRK
jgi:hypothetical protein